MKYQSTRGIDQHSFKDILFKGLAKDGGLFIPVEWPKFDLEFISKIDLNINFKVSGKGRIASIVAYTQKGRQLVQGLKS